MSDLLLIEEEFAHWVHTHLIPSIGITSKDLETSRWTEQTGSTDAPAYSRWVYAANVHYRDKNFEAAGYCYAKAVLLLGGITPAGVGFGVLKASCVADDIDTVIANAANSGNLAAVFAKLLEERDARFSAPQPREPEPTCRDRNMDNAYHAVATFQTCLWYLHSKRPDLAMCDLHNMCFLVDSVFYQNFRTTLFGTPRLAHTGVVYESRLDGSLHGILDAVLEKLHGTSASGIKGIVLNESPCKGRVEGEDVCYPCMPVDDLVPSDIVTALAACTGVRFDYGDVGTTVPIDEMLRLTGSNSLETIPIPLHTTHADAHARLVTELEEARQTIAELQAKLAQWVMRRAREDECLSSNIFEPERT
jgi:hypothetical protein